MDLRNYLGVFRARWKTFAIGFLICVALSAAWSLHTPAQYAASGEIFISTQDQGGASLGAAYQGNLLGQDRVKSYSLVVTEPIVLDPVIQQLKLPMTSDELAKDITVTTGDKTVIMQITVKMGSADEARNIATAVMDRVIRVIPTLEAPNGTGAVPVVATVIRPANGTVAQVAPQPTQAAVLGILLGIVVGVVAVAIREALGAVVTTADDVNALTGRLPLSEVPVSKTRRELPPLQALNEPARREAIRRLRTNLRFVAVDQPPRAVVVTSPLSGDGKSVTACQLAATLARPGRRVLLVDADLRKPSIAGCLGLEKGAGLTSVLVGAADVSDVVQSGPVDDLEVLVAGPLPPDPGELLGSDAMVKLTARLLRDYEYVIIDSPPILAVPDAAILLTVADGGILVVRSGTTRREQLSRAQALIANVNGRLVGTVLNMVAKSRVSHPDYYGQVVRPEHFTATTSGPGEPAAPARPAKADDGGEPKPYEDSPTRSLKLPDGPRAAVEQPSRRAGG